jgi:cytidylate kinase
MAIRVVTMEREYGSGGGQIATLLGRRLGWTVWDQALTTEVSRLAHERPVSATPRGLVRAERPDPLLYRLAKVFARGSYERSMPLEVTGESNDAERIVQLVTQVVERVGAAGRAVIVGRGAAYILREHPEAFHVFVYAPYQEKLRRVIEGGKSREEAEELLETVDRERADFVKQYTGNDWPNRYLYNLWVNSAMGDEVLVEIILDAISRLDRKRPGPRPSP